MKKLIALIILSSWSLLHAGFFKTGVEKVKTTAKKAATKVKQKFAPKPVRSQPVRRFGTQAKPDIQVPMRRSALAIAPKDITQRAQNAYEQTKNYISQIDNWTSEALKPGRSVDQSISTLNKLKTDIQGVDMRFKELDDKMQKQIDGMERQFNLYKKQYDKEGLVENSLAKQHMDEFSKEMNELRNLQINIANQREVLKKSQTNIEANIKRLDDETSKVASETKRVKGVSEDANQRTHTIVKDLHSKIEEELKTGPRVVQIKEKLKRELDEIKSLREKNPGTEFKEIYDFQEKIARNNAKWETAKIRPEAYRNKINELKTTDPEVFNYLDQAYGKLIEERLEQANKKIATNIRSLIEKELEIGPKVTQITEKLNRELQEIQSLREKNPGTEFKEIYDFQEKIANNNAKWETAKIRPEAYRNKINELRTVDPEVSSYLDQAYGKLIEERLEQANKEIATNIRSLEVAQKRLAQLEEEAAKKSRTRVPTEKIELEELGEEFPPSSV